MGTLVALAIATVALPNARAVERGKASTTKESAVEENQAGPDSKKPELPPRRMPPRGKGEISFDTILFEMDKEEPFKREMITKEIEALEGKTVKIRGYILPASVFQQDGIKQFVLVRDNKECCFGPGAALYDCIMIRMVGGATAKFSTRPVAVKGKFHVTDKYKYPDGKYMAIYEMEGIQVQ